MKKFNKKTAIVLSVIMSIILVVGVIFSFVPMNFGSKKWESFAGSISVSSDLTGGLYGEFNIKTQKPSKDDMISSMQKIRDVFEEDGFKNVNVYAVGTEKIRVEAAYSRTSRSYAEVYNKIASVGAGAFSLRTTYEMSETTVSVLGKDCVSGVDVYTNNDVNYLSIKFNKEGEKQFKELCEGVTTDNSSSPSIYIALGDYAQQITISGITSYSEFTLSDEDYSNLIQLKNNVVLGCMKIELDTSSAKINTMSASLSAGESAGTPEVSSYASSTVFILMNAALLSIIVTMIAFFAARYGFYFLVMLLTMVINTCLFVMILNLMPSVEIGLSSYFALVVGVGIIYTYALKYASLVKSEYKAGKSLGASLQSAYKKTMPTTLIANIVLFVSSLIFLAFSFGEITSAAIVLAICSFLSLLTNLLIIPFLVKICISFGNFGFKLFMLKKRLDFSNSANENASLKEAE